MCPKTTKMPNNDIHQWLFPHAHPTSSTSTRFKIFTRKILWRPKWRNNHRNQDPWNSNREQAVRRTLPEQKKSETSYSHRIHSSTCPRSQHCQNSLQILTAALCDSPPFHRHTTPSKYIQNLKTLLNNIHNNIHNNH